MLFRRRIALAGLFAVALFLGVSNRVAACPYCGVPQKTLTEEFTDADAVVLAQWRAGRAPAGMLGHTTFSVVELARGPKEAVKKDDQIKIAQYRAAKKGDLFLLFGTKGKEIEWNNPLEVTETAYQYIVQAPSLKTPTPKRLEYFVKFLESSDQLISNDAFGEFANAPYEDIVQVKQKLDRVKVGKWLADPETSQTRLALYGLLLGLCGNDDDARLMLAKINQPKTEYPLGLDGLISGYLVLAGEKGLDAIDQSKIKNQKAEFNDTYAALQALRFMETYGNGRISRERLRQSLRELLNRPELADLVVRDLARWEDWSVQDRLMQLYDKEEYSLPMTKRAIIGYMLRAAQTNAKPDNLPPSAVQARANLDKLRRRDPQKVADAERSLFVD
ncbi:MAG: hypothetical protein ACKV2Q_30270 [Planctomycetaceae bacterium]